MHLIATIPGGWNPDDDGVFHIQQKPGDIVFLSAADTELFAVNNGYKTRHNRDQDSPSLRLANLTYFKQELTVDTYLDEVVSKAKVVIIKLLGGTAYFPYLCEAILECSETNGFEVIFLPGDATPDLELMQISTLDLVIVEKLWKYLLAGGPENIDAALDVLFQIANRKQIQAKPISNLSEFFFLEQDGKLSDTINQNFDSPWSLILSYRSYYQADNLTPIRDLMQELKNQGIIPIVFFAPAYRDANVESRLFQGLNGLVPNVIINTTGFSIHSFSDQSSKLFGKLNVPVVQSIIASSNFDTWNDGLFGLTPTDIAMQVALPEVDGKIITSIVSFKESAGKDPVTDSEIIEYTAHQEGILRVVNHVKSWCGLQQTPNAHKRIAVVLPNYPTKNSRLANGVGLDTPESTINILKALKEADYTLDSRLPQTSKDLINLITQGPTNDRQDGYHRTAEVHLSNSTFLEYYHQLSIELRQKIEDQWGDLDSFESEQPKSGIPIPGVLLGNIFLSIQPARGYNVDPTASYHSPDLPPTYLYLAYYFWIHHKFDAQAIIHVGKHGNLEWLPGKSVALSEKSCFPATILKPIPHFYPFIINDPGEGTQAKRRSHAIIIDHLVPPLTRAENHGDLLKLELLIDEYYEAAQIDRKRETYLKSKIEELVASSLLYKDINANPDTEIDELLETIDGYLCELKEAQIRGGLHILGTVNETKLADLLIALHRLPQGRRNKITQGITQAIAKDYQLPFDPLHTTSTPSELFPVEISGIECRSFGQAIEILENTAKELVDPIVKCRSTTFNAGPNTTEVLEEIRTSTLPLVEASNEEIGNLLNGLNGQYIPAGPSGAPTRGRIDILPTGRNFYTVDVRTIPSNAAYELGTKSAKNIIQRYLQENGEYPTSIGVSVWGTSTMRTGGDDIGQALALMGVRPVWHGANRRVIDFEVISLLELQRPRVDVTLRISGFFRDAFPDVISFFNSAVLKVAQMDEPPDKNPIRARYMVEKENWEQTGLSQEQAHDRSLFRVFGSKPGAYGAGLQGLIDEKNWETQEDLAMAYVNWSGYAYYGQSNEGRSAHESFRKRLGGIDAVIQNQDNREHDLLDSDDYYQFQGGMTAAVKSEKGTAPNTYFGDHSRPDNPRIKSLKEELLKVYRSRVINPKWITGMQDHGYKGAFEMAATMDYLFAYDATTNLIDDFMYEGITEAYLLDKENQKFIRENNPWALKDMSERMLEAVQRGMWENPSEEIIDQLKSLYLQTDSILEQ